MKSLILLTSLCLLSSQLSAGRAGAGQQDYQQWRMNKLAEFQNYLDKNDRAFMSFLQKKWEPVQVDPASKHDPQPKPLSIPLAKVPEDTKRKPGIDTPPEAPVDEQPLKKQPKPTRPTVKKIDKKPIYPVVKNDRYLNTANFDFYGHTVSIRYKKSFKKIFSGSITSKKIADYWKHLATQPHKDLITQLNQQVKQLDLNDWGAALLFDRFVGSLFNNSNSRRLTTWFLLIKAGFDARIAYNQSIYLLMPSKQPIYGVTYFTINHQRYYAVNLSGKSLNPGKVFTYSGQHQQGKRTLDFSDPDRFVTQATPLTKKLVFNYQQKKHRIQLNYSGQFIRYLNSFPQLSLHSYFASNLPKETAQSLLQQLTPVIKGKSEKESINILLHFVQTAFRYKTDDQQFNREKYMFPLETLHYPFSDCEDRASLFAWLVKSLLKLDAVILDYPGHVAVAVALSEETGGDSWRYKGRRYTVADPTYINATLGMTMPGFKGKKPNITAI